MHIAIQTSHLQLDAFQRQRIERRAGFTLSRLGTHIRNVVVHLCDINGPRGGIDKRCRVVVQLERGPAVVVEDVDSKLPNLVDRALARAARAARKRVSLGTLHRRPKEGTARPGLALPSDAQ